MMQSWQSVYEGVLNCDMMVVQASIYATLGNMEARPFLNLELLEDLASLARAEGFRFLDRLKADWEAGTLRFDQTGEILLGTWREGSLIAVGGVRRQSEGTGRISRVYVHPDWRRQGVGARLVSLLIGHSQPVFTTLILRTDTKEGAGFYEALGFELLEEPGEDLATHRLIL